MTKGLGSVTDLQIGNMVLSEWWAAEQCVYHEHKHKLTCSAHTRHVLLLPIYVQVCLIILHGSIIFLSLSDGVSQINAITIQVN